MKRQGDFTKKEIRDLRTFALGMGLGFARDMRPADGLRRQCVHEAGHAAMYFMFGIPGWRVEVGPGGAELFLAPTNIRVEQSIVISLAGPLAEERWCGIRGVFRGALDDLWQAQETAERGGHDAKSLKALVASTREALHNNSRFVLAIADVLQRDGRLDDSDLGAVADVMAGPQASCLARAS